MPISRIPTKIRSPPKVEETLLNLLKPAVNPHTPIIIRSSERYLSLILLSSL